MKKFQLLLIVLLLVAYCTLVLASVPADNRRQANLTQVTIVKILEDKLTVRNTAGQLVTYEIGATLRANKFFSRYKPGDVVRIQVQGNLLIQAEGNNPPVVPNQNQLLR
jgi:hypothetical protein